jgi:uncharacterized membrane protein YvlD (DUF360 family)
MSLPRIPQGATPKVAFYSGVTAAAVLALVNAQVNTLMKTLNAPLYGQTMGAVVAGSISVAPIGVTFDSNNAQTWFTTVSWTEFITPS